MSDWVLEVLGEVPQPSLEERKAAVYKFVCAFRAANPYGPTVREIQQDVPASTSTIHKILKELKSSGLVTWEERLARTLRPVDA